MMPKKEHIQRFGFLLFGVGIALLGEHMVSKGFTSWELFGHETYGLISIIVSFFLLMKKNNARPEVPRCEVCGRVLDCPECSS